MTGQRDVVIVGASAAGLSAADGLREGGFDGSITVLGAELHEPYDRPSLSKGLLLTDGDPALLALRSPERLAAARIELLLGHAASGLDIDRRYVITTYGETLRYDAVILACGSRPREMRTAGGQPLPVLRTPEDLRAIRAAAAAYGEVTVIGSGFIGLEVAAGLAERGIAVHLFSASRLPFDEVVGAEVAAVLRDLHLAHGVTLHGGTVVRAVTGVQGAYELELEDGGVHRTAFAVAGIGVEPETDWLVGSGVDLDKGVVVDRAGRTSAPGVWAAGDVATFYHPLLDKRVRVEHWMHAVQQGRHVGLNVARGDTAPYHAVPYFWTEQFGRRLDCYGRRRPGDEIIVAEGSLGAGEFLVLYGRGDKFTAVASCGRAKSLKPYRKLLERRASWDEARSLARGDHPASVG